MGRNTFASLVFGGAPRFMAGHLGGRMLGGAESPHPALHSCDPPRSLGQGPVTALPRSDGRTGAARTCLSNGMDFQQLFAETSGGWFLGLFLLLTKWKDPNFRFLFFFSSLENLGSAFSSLKRKVSSVVTLAQSDLAVGRADIL